MKKLVIGEFNDSFPPVMDGVGNVANNYTKNLRKLGHDAYAIVSGEKDSKEYDRKEGIDYAIHGKTTVPMKSMAPYGIVSFKPELKKRIEKMPFDIVHAHCPFATGKLALKIAKRNNIPIVSTFHTFFRDDIYGFVKNNWISDSAMSIVMKYYYMLDEVWTPSEAAKAKIINDYKFKGNIRVVENGCDFEVPDEKTFIENKKRGKELAGVGQDEDRPILIYVGQHKDEKNIMLILSSLKILKENGSKFKMVFVGDGHDKGKFEKYVKDNNLEDVIVFLGRISDRTKIIDLFCASHLFIFPSLYDTSCLVMREAACFNLPLIYIEGSCTSEGIEDGVNGFLGKNDIPRFAEKLKYIIENKDARDRAGEGAHKTLYRSWETAVKEVESLYYEIIERKKSQIIKNLDLIDKL